MLLGSLLLDITGGKLFFSEINHFIQQNFASILQSNFDTEINFVRVSAIDCRANGVVLAPISSYNADGKLVFTKALDVSCFVNFAISSANRTHFLTHSTPDECKQSEVIYKNCKKIYIVRDFRSAFHSHIRSIGKEEEDVLHIRNISNDMELYYAVRYGNVETFMVFLKRWKEHVLSYLKNKDDFVLIKYEDLVSSPKESISFIAESFGIKLSNERIAEIVENNLNKDVWLFGRPTDSFRHFNGVKPPFDKWSSYFSTRMVELVKKEIGDLLIEFGYENDDDWGIVEDNNWVRLANEKRFSEWKYFELSDLTDTLDRELSNKKVVFFGAGEYAKMLIPRLKNRQNILFAVDERCFDDSYDFFGIPIKKLDSLVYDYCQYEKIIVTPDIKRKEEIISKLNNLNIPSEKIEFVFTARFYDQMKKEIANA